MRNDWNLGQVKSSGFRRERQENFFWRKIFEVWYHSPKSYQHHVQGQCRNNKPNVNIKGSGIICCKIRQISKSDTTAILVM